MEFHILSFSPTMASILVILVITFLLHILRYLKKVNVVNNQVAPPQAKGAWPIIGHLHLLGGSRLPHKVLGDMADKHGPIFTIKLGVHHVLVVSGGEVAKECLTTNDRIFASRPKSKPVEILGYNYAMLGLAPYGDYWRQLRKVVMLEILSQKRVEMVGHVRVSEVRASVNDVYYTWLMNKDDEGLDGMVKVDMKQWFGNLVLNIMVRIVSGKRFLVNDEEGVRFQNVSRKLAELLGTFVASDFIPFANGLDIGGYEKEMKMTAKELDTIIQGWLNKRKSEAQQQEGNQVFMDVLASVLQDSSDEDFAGYHHDTIIKATCLAIIIAGSDTTSLTLTWALTLLLNNPDTLKTAQDEIDELVGRDKLTMVEESDIKNLVYINAVIKETLRLYPSAPLSLPHESMEDCVVRGYNIPKGTRLLVNLWKIHRDPKIWSDPSKFKPERFLTSQKDIDLKGNHFELLPFGSGRRMCPGVFFALQVLSLTLASVIQQFVLHKPTNEPIDMSETAGLSTGKAMPLEVLLAPRLPLNMYHVDV